MKWWKLRVCTLAGTIGHKIISLLRLTFSQRIRGANFCFDIPTRVYTRAIRDLSLIWRQDGAGGTTRGQLTTSFLPVSCLREAYYSLVMGVIPVFFHEF